VTYEEWKDYWPNATSDLDFANFINNTPKYVASNTLDSVTWGSYNTVNLIKGDLAAEINRLKALPGKNISVAGSPGLVRSLLQLGLVDEYIPLIHPVVAGKGKRLFRDGDDLKRFKLARSKITGSGVAILTYVPRT
jgi:dihydrofolate reductase